MTNDWTAEDVQLLRGLLQRESVECAQLGAAAAGARRADVVQVLETRRKRCAVLAGALGLAGHQHAHWLNSERNTGDTDGSGGSRGGGVPEVR